MGSLMKDIIKKKKFLFFFGIAFLIVIIDQITKIIAPNVVQNTGAAFGLFKDSTMFLIGFAIAVVIVILYFYKKIPRKYSILTYVSLIFGGTIGNLIDRVAFGFVRDFIDLRVWPAFNIADAAVTIGVIGLIVYLIWKK